MTMPRREKKKRGSAVSDFATRRRRRLNAGGEGRVAGNGGRNDCDEFGGGFRMFEARRPYLRLGRSSVSA